LKTDWRRDLVGIVVVGGFVIVCVLLLRGGTVDKDVHDIAVSLLGTLGAALMLIVGYYYGSSSGSQAKDQTIQDMSKKP
jgi:hypothetical protein